MLGPEEGGVAFVRLIPPPDLPNAPAEDRLGGFVVFVSVGLALCSFLLCFSMFLGDKVDVLVRQLDIGTRVKKHWTRGNHLFLFHCRR